MIDQVKGSICRQNILQLGTRKGSYYATTVNVKIYSTKQVFLSPFPPADRSIRCAVARGKRAANR